MFAKKVGSHCDQLHLCARDDQHFARKGAVHAFPAACLAVICLFMAFLLAGMRIALHAADRFGCLLAAGIICMISVQAFINMGVVVGVLPTTGLPLPFFSAGGTSLSITMAAVGIVLNVSRSGLNNLG